MSQIKFLTLSGLSVFKDNIISIIEDNELVTSTALINLNDKIDNLDIPIESGDGDNSIQLKNTENNANGWGSVALFGYGNTAGASNTFVGGDSNQAYGTGSVVIGGKNNKIEGTGEFSAIVGGDENLVTGDRAFAFGHNVKVYSQYGASFGYNNTVSGLSGFAEGTRNTVSAHGAHAEGAGTTASGEFSHSEGFETIASGAHGHSEGYQTQAINTDAHAEGHLSISAEHASHAEGWQTYAGGWSTHTEGIETQTTNHNGEHAQGKYNMSNPGTIHSIGIGSDSNNRKNAMEVTEDGKHYIIGIGGYDGTNIGSASDLASTIVTLNEVTYATLYEYVENSKLVPGAKYRITDYETIVETSAFWQSANHPFDIIVTAISQNRLDENATCCLSARDTDGYFANCGIESWKIKYTIYNDDSYGWANSNGKGVIYWMEDNNRNFCPFDFKNIRINPNGGSGTTPQDTLAKAAEQGVTTDDIASRYMLSGDGFYYVFSSFDGTVDRSLNKHFIQDSGFGILGKSDEVQYLSGSVIICPENTEIHHVTVNYGYWSAIIVTGCLAGDTAKTVVRNLNINHMSKSYIIVGQAYDTYINSIAGSYIYVGFTFGQPNFIGHMTDSYMYVVYRATSNVIKYAYGVAISCQRFESNDFDILQYVSYPGVFDKNIYNATELSDGTKVTKINYLTCKQALITGSKAAYLNVRDLVTAGSLLENTGYRQILYFDNGGILKAKPEFKIYNINSDTTYIADGDTDTDKKISINDNIINVALSNHTHTFTVNDNTDTIESILESFSTLIADNATNLATHITDFETYKTNHGSGVHISTAAQSFAGQKTFSGGIKIRKSYYALNSAGLIPYPNDAAAISSLSGVGLSFLHTNGSNCLAGLGLLPESSKITDENIYDGLVIDANSSVIIRSRYGLRIGTAYPSGSRPFTNRISFGQDIDNAYIDVPEIAKMNIFAGNSLDLSTLQLSLSSDTIKVGTSNPKLSSNSSLTIETTGNLTLNSSATSPIICKSAVQSAYVYDHGTITDTTKTINLQSGCLNKIEINANCALALTLSNPNITSFNEYSAHCIISCGTSVSSTNTITLPAMCGTAQTIQYSKTSIIELDIIAYPESSNGAQINYLCSWQYHRL